MAAEHLNGVDVNDEFVTGNYGIATTSRIEWLFSTDDAATPESLDLRQWPADRICRCSDNLLTRRGRLRAPSNGRMAPDRTRPLV